MTFGIEEQIFRFNIPVSDTLTMEIGDSMKYLLETALGLAGAHASVKGISRRSMKMKKMHSPLLDCSVQISSWTKLHDFTPMLILILDQINGLDDIGMMQGR